jgi:hypothetical protein
MEKVNFTGLVYLHLLKKMPYMYNFMTENGGEVYLMG